MHFRPQLESLESRNLCDATPLVPPGPFAFNQWIDPTTGSVRQYYEDRDTGLWHYQEQASPQTWIDRPVTAAQSAAIDAVLAHFGPAAAYAALAKIADADPPAFDPTAPIATTEAPDDQVSVVHVPAGASVTVNPYVAPPPIYVPPPPLPTAAEVFQQDVDALSHWLVVMPGETLPQVQAAYPALAEFAPDILDAAYATILARENQQ